MLHSTFRDRLALAAATGAALALMAGSAAAQVYRSVGPDGRVVYSDKPPAANARDNAPAGAGTGAGGSSAGGLPYQLNQVAQRFPVTLYSGKDCAPCDSGRNLLVNRGIPFTEKTVNTDADVKALQRLTGDTNLPVATVGGQRLSGFSDAEWSQYLDAAGYPKQSQLPRNYRQPAPTPLVAVKEAAPAPAASAPDQTPATRRPAPAPRPAPSNPAGIIF